MQSVHQDTGVGCAFVLGFAIGTSPLDPVGVVPMVRAIRLRPAQGDGAGGLICYLQLRDGIGG